MTFSLTWLPSVLRQVGLKVAEVPGWESRGRGDMGRVLGVMCHHTVGPKTGNMPSLNLITKGSKKLSGPLSQLGLGRDGTFYVVAAGRANHAGGGVWRRQKDGNGNFIGVEAENMGTKADFPWPEVQMDAYRRGVAAILAHVGQPAELCCGHREFAVPAGRKIDPLFDMAEFREGVAAIVAGTAPAPTLIPAADPQSRSTLRRGATGALVEEMQGKLDISPTGPFGPRTEAAVRALQREHGLVPDGIVGPKTWELIDKLA